MLEALCLGKQSSDYFYLIWRFKGVFKEIFVKSLKNIGKSRFKGIVSGNTINLLSARLESQPILGQVQTPALEPIIFNSGSSSKARLDSDLALALNPFRQQIYTV